MLSAVRPDCRHTVVVGTRGVGRGVPRSEQSVWVRQTAIILLWLSALGWLIIGRVLPRYHAGTPPTYQQLLPDRPAELSPIRWQIWLDRRPLGQASTRIVRYRDGQGAMSSSLELQDLSLSDFWRPQGSTGVGSFLLDRLFPWSDVASTQHQFSLRVDSQMDFDHFGQLHGFESQVDIDDLEQLVRIQGLVLDGKLRVRAYVHVPQGEGEMSADSLVSDMNLPLPSGHIVADDLTPRPRFVGLRLGQSWQFETYRPLAPNSPLQLVEATVAKRESLNWNGRSEPVYRIDYHRPASEGLSVNRHLGSVWVLAKEGTAIRQTVRFGGRVLRFERLADEAQP